MICFPIHWQPWCDFLTKEWYGFPAYTGNLLIKAYQDYVKRGFKNQIKALCPWGYMLFCVGSGVLFTKDHLRSISFFCKKCTSRLADKRIHIKLVSSRPVGTVLSWLTARDCNNITPPLTILDKVVKLMEGASDHRFDLVDPSGSRSSRLPSPFDTTLYNGF